MEDEPAAAEHEKADQRLANRSRGTEASTRPASSWPNHAWVTDKGSDIFDGTVIDCVKWIVCNRICMYVEVFLNIFMMKKCKER